MHVVLPLLATAGAASRHQYRLFFSGFTIKVKIYVLFYKGRKFFTGKTNGFFTFLNLYSKKCIGPLKRKVLQVLNRENAWRKHFHDCFRFRLPRKPILGTQR